MWKPEPGTKATAQTWCGWGRERNKLSMKIKFYCHLRFASGAKKGCLFSYYTI